MELLRSRVPCRAKEAVSVVVRGALASAFRDKSALTSRIHASGNAPIEPAMPTGVSHVLVHVAIALVLAHVRMTARNRAAEEGLASVAGDRFVVVTGGNVSADLTKCSLRNAHTSF